MYNILIVDDDLENCSILEECLSLSGKYRAVSAHDADSALALVQQQHVDLILLDIVLPSTDGIDLCSRLRKMLYCPIIFMSCLSDDDTIVRAMRMGGDDYMTKPFRFPVLEAHIEAVLRRASTPRTAASAAPGGMILSHTDHTLERGGKKYYLSPTEYELLLLFLNNPNVLLSFETIYQKVWGKPSLGDFRTVFSHVHNLRKKLEPDPSNPIYIRTVPRQGYVYTGEEG